MTLFPESTSVISEKSSTTRTGIRTQPRRGVRLFQKRSDNSDVDESIAPSTSTSITKKRTATRSSRKNIKRTASEEDITMETPTKRSRRRGVSSTTDTMTTTITTSDGTSSSNTVPVTPETSSTSSTPSRTRKTKSKSTTRKTKTTTTKTKSKKKTKTKSSVAASASVWSEPDGWRDIYELVQELRKDKTAPCDTAGAEALVLPPIDGEQNDELYAKTRRFQTLVALMLSSQTKDAMVERAMENLRATDGDGGGDGLTIASIMVMDPEVLNSKINMVGFHNNKTKYLKQVAEILHEKYDDDIPLTADEMIRNLPGIGPKMAYIIEPICWEYPPE
jgi:endonuclease-3